MKKWMSILTAVVLMLSMTAAAMAETAGARAVPSKTTSDASQVAGVETTTGAPIPDTFVVAVTEDTEPVIQEIENLYSFVNDPEKAGAAAPIEYFQQEVRENVRKQLVDMGMPEDYDITQLELNEFVTIQEIGYEQAYGDVKVRFTFTTAYQAGQKLVGLVGFYSGEQDEDGNYIVVWEVAPAEVQADGTVAVTLSQDQLLRFRESAATSLAVLSEPMPQPAQN